MISCICSSLANPYRSVLLADPVDGIGPVIHDLTDLVGAGTRSEVKVGRGAVPGEHHCSDPADEIDLVACGTEQLCQVRRKEHQRAPTTGAARESWVGA